MSCIVPESGRLCGRRVSAVLAVLAALLLAGPASARIFQFDNATAGGLTGCGAPLTRTFAVGFTFNVTSVALGLNVSHNDRDEVRAILTSPGGAASVVLLPGPGTGDGSNNYDILLSTNTEGDLDDGDNDTTAAPIYNRTVPVAGMSAFAGVAANGTWTLQVCDNAGGAAGTFNSARAALTRSR